LSFGDLHLLVGLFGFYSRWIPWFEDKIGPWRQILKLKPLVHTSVEEEAAKLEANWTLVAAQLLDEMKEAIISGPVLRRPDWNRTFYVKTDWSSYAKGGALCQPECSPEAEEALQKDIEGKDAGFDKTISGFRLRPVSSFPRRILRPSNLITAVLENWLPVLGHSSSGTSIFGFDCSFGSPIATASPSFG
jgi:RNase H-like domain found in reverse transcriptase